MRLHRLLTAILMLAAAAATGSAQAIPKVNFTDTRLKNGMRVIVSADRAAPVVSVSVSYNVGSRNERKGRTGFAHLFEHLMFKGSENVADGEFAALIENYGGNHNGQTDKDHTIYFEQVPSNQLDMVLFLEADRMRSPAITQANVDNQREAVKEERRLRVDNQPYGRTSELLAELAFENFRQRALHHRLDGRSRCGIARRLRGVLQDVLRAEQCRAGVVGRRRREGGSREDSQVLRSHSLRSPPARAGCGGVRRRRKSAAAPCRIRWRGSRWSTRRIRCRAAFIPTWTR